MLSGLGSLAMWRTGLETNATKRRGGFMASNNFTNKSGNFTVSDQAIAPRNQAVTLGWSLDDWGKLYSAAAELDQREVLVGSPSTSTYQHWFGKSGLFLYTNP
jgi:hypothetical protein